MDVSYLEDVFVHKVHILEKKSLSSNEETQGYIAEELKATFEETLQFQLN